MPVALIIHETQLSHTGFLIHTLYHLEHHSHSSVLRCDMLLERKSNVWILLSAQRPREFYLPLMVNKLNRICLGVKYPFLTFFFINQCTLLIWISFFLLFRDIFLQLCQWMVVSCTGFGVSEPRNSLTTHRLRLHTITFPLIDLTSLLLPPHSSSSPSLISVIQYFNCISLLFVICGLCVDSGTLLH